MDNCSNLNVIKDRELAIGTKVEKVATRISGSIPGSLVAQTSAEIGDFGRGCFDTKFSRNLISEIAAIRAGYRVTRDSNNDDSYYLTKDGRPPLKFTANAEGTFSMPTGDFIEHFKDLYATANATDVDRTAIVFTKRQREGAARYHFDHGHCLNHIHPERVIVAIKKGLIQNVPYTEADVRNAMVIYGPCSECAKCKGTKHRQLGHYPMLPERPGEHLAGDLFTIMGCLFSVISCRLIKLKCVTRLKNKGAMEITRAIRDCVNVWKGFGSRPKYLAWDQEPALIHSAAEIRAQHRLKLIPTPPDAHERMAERDVRTIKEHVYANIMSLNHAIDEEMVEGLVRDTVTLMNFMPNSETVDGSARTYLDGERLDYERWSRVYAGQVAEFEVPYAKTGGQGTRKELGYVLCHQGDNPVVRLLPGGKRTVIRSGHVTVLEKSPAIIKLIESGITGAKRQRYNDLLGEIKDFYEDNEWRSDVPTTPQLGPLDKEDQVESSTLDQNFTTLDSRDNLPVHAPLVDNIPPHQATSFILPSAPVPPPDETITNPTEVASSDVREQPHVVPTIRRSSRAGAAKPEGYYAKLNSGESVADYTACHMRAQECSALYGENETTEAGETEVLNMIKDRNAAEPTDYRKLSPRDIREALPSFIFFKAKDLLPDGEMQMDEPMSDDEPPEFEEDWQEAQSKRKKRGKKAAEKRKKAKLRARWVGGGHRQIKGDILAERVAPTARAATHNLVMAIAAFEGRKIRVGDIPSAYLQAEHVPSNGRPVHIVADRYVTSLIVKRMPEYGKFVRPNGTMILRVKKAMYGLVESAWLWYKELEKQLVSIGYSVSLNDRGLFYKKVMKNGKCIASNIASVHVDDIISAASPNSEGDKLASEFWGFLESKWPGVKLQLGPNYKHLSWNIFQDPRTGEIKKSQRDYLLEVVKTAGVTKEHNLPSRSNLLESDLSSPKLSAVEVSNFRSILQKVAYAREGRPDLDFVVCYLQSKQSEPTEQDKHDLDHLIGYIKRYPEKQVTFKPKDLQLRGHADASFNITRDARSYYGYIITLGHALISSKGGRIKTVVRSSTEAEISAVNEIVSELLWCRDVMEELGYPQSIMPVSEDNNQSCITMLQKEPRSFHSKSRHVRVKWAFFRQDYAKRTLKLRYCSTDKMVADLLTKPLGGKAHALHSATVFSGSEP